MPWLIKNDDVVRLEPSQQQKKKMMMMMKEVNNDPTTLVTTITTPNTSSSSVGAAVTAAAREGHTGTTPPSTSSSSLFFIHVPRCGGTSLMHYYQLPKKIYTYYQYNYWKQLGMYAFFSRYKTLEKYNFPVWTSGNGFALMITILGIYFMIDTKNNYIPYNLGVLLILFGVTLFVLLTIIFTAPVIGRFPFIHHAYLIFVHYLLCQFMECTTYCTGTNKTGYIMHLTAHKLLHTYQYVTVPQWNISCSMAIIRNPYSRMISIYTYNRFGEWETFTHFIHDWYHNVCKYYRANKECDEWYTPCHAIPQFEYTHYNGTQLVKSIIKQEELKYLKETYKTTTTTPHTNHNNNSIPPESESNGSNVPPPNHIADTEWEDLESSKEPMMTPTGEDTAETSHSNTVAASTTPPPPTMTTATIESDTSLNNTSGKSTSIQNLPDTVRDALMNMPHSNQRVLSQGKWYDYYTQETLNMVYEIYFEDFNYFHYNPILVQRPDLEPPLLYHQLYQPRNQIPTTTTTTTTINSNNNISLDGDMELGTTPTSL